MLIEKYTTSITFTVTDEMAEQLNAAANEFGVSRSDIIRVCIQNDLPKLKDRERKRKKSRTVSNKNKQKP